MKTQEIFSDFTVRKVINGLRKMVLYPDLWIIIATFAALLFVLLVILGVLDIFLPDKPFVVLIKEVYAPILAVVGFSVGFALTIQSTLSRIRETTYNIEKQKEERFRESLTLLNKRGLDAIGAIFNIFEDAKKLDPTKYDYKEELQKYVSTLCAFLRVTSIKDGSSISDLDNNDWKNDKGEICVPEHVTQRIIELLFPLNSKDEKDRENDNPFHRIIGTFRIDLSLCDLRNIDLSGRIVKNVNFGGSAMQGAKMHDAEFDGCTFWGTYLQSTNMAKSRFTDCNFNEARMIWANMCDATFTDCNFDNANMSCVLLSKAVFVKDNKFHEAILDGADIYLEKRTDGVNLQPKIFQNYSELGLESVKFAFIRPLQDDGRNMVIDMSLDIYEIKPNRLERYITYLMKLEGDEENTLKTSLDTETIRNNKEKLLGLCYMALKYAIVERSTNLSQERYKELTGRMSTLINRIRNNHKNDKK